MKTIRNVIFYAGLMFLGYVLGFGMKHCQPHSPITRVEITKWKDRLVIQKDSSAANLKIVYRDRVKTERIEKLVKGDSWPFYVTDSNFCDSSIRHLLGAVKHLEKQHEFDSAVQNTLEMVVSVQDSVINQQGKQIAKGEKAIKKRRMFNRIMLGIMGAFLYLYSAK